jgi:hypothetical protein
LVSALVSAKTNSTRDNPSFRIIQFWVSAMPNIYKPDLGQFVCPDRRSDSTRLHLTLERLVI